MFMNNSNKIQGPPSNVFFSTSFYFVNGNTWLMSGLTDNQIHPFAERIWLCIRLNNTGKWASDRLTKDDDFGKNKIIFSGEAHFDIGGYKQNCRLWGTENPHAYIEKPTNPKRVTVLCGFWSKGIIGSFFFENEQGEVVTVNGDRYRAMLNEFLFTKIEEEPKLRSMF